MTRIDKIFAFCAQHPVKELDARWFVPQLSSGLPAIIDLRECGVVGLLMDRGITASGDIPVEVIGGALNEANARDFFHQLFRQAAQLKIRKIEFPIFETHEALCREIIKERQGIESYIELEMKCPALVSRQNVPLPPGWRWADLSPEFLPGFDRVRDAAFKGIPGVVLRREPSTMENMLKNKIRLLLAGEEIAGFIQVNLEKKFIWTILRDPRFRAQGVGMMLMEELARLLERGQASLNVIEGNRPAIELYEKYGFKIKGRVPYYSVPAA